MMLMNGTTGEVQEITAKPFDLIAAAIAKAVEQTGWVRKDGQAPKFKFASSEAILGEVRHAMAAQGLAVICTPTIDRVGEHKSAQGNALQVWRVDNHIRLLHTSGQSLETVYPAIVTDADAGVAILKGITVSLRYFLQNLLIVPRGDDPEADEKPTQPRQEPAKQEPAKAEPKRPVDQWAADELKARIVDLHSTKDLRIVDLHSTKDLRNAAWQACGNGSAIERLAAFGKACETDLVALGLADQLALERCATAAASRAQARLSDLDGEVREPPVAESDSVGAIVALFGELAEWEAAARKPK